MSSSPTVDPSSRCPKCARAHAPGEPACARCGLLAARFSSYRARPAEPAEVTRLFNECAAAWQDAARHDRLIAAALRLHALPELTRRYHDRMSDRADPIAARRLRQIAILVEAALASQTEHVVSPVTSQVVRVASYAFLAQLVVSSALLLLHGFFVR